jgi:hypothetical protein
MSIGFDVNDLCDNTFRYDSVPIYTSTGNVEFGQVLYADSSGTIPYTGYRLIYLTDFCTVLTIDASTAQINGFGGTCQNCF